MPSANHAPLARRLADFLARFHADDLPQAVLERAKLHWLDALGLALAASTYDFARITERALRAIPEPGDSPVIGAARGLPLRDALLLNGLLVHGLDFDDTHPGSVVHCSASAVPLALGLSTLLGVSGRQALAAYVLAVEIDARIGDVARGGLQARGWHPTGVVGAFGCAAAACWLLGGDVEAQVNTLGITHSFASGNLEFLADGAWTKRLHPGWAAVAGYTAARLGLGGYIGPSQPFEGRFGLYNLFLGEGERAEPSTANLGQSWALMDNAFKPYPACHFMHAFIDCALALRAGPEFAVEDIERVEALIHPDETAVVCEPVAAKLTPKNAYEAQFSLPYAVAAALRLGRFSLRELEADARTDPATLALAARVQWLPDPLSRYPQGFSGALRVHLRDGSLREIRRDSGLGSNDFPLTATDVRAKFDANAGLRYDIGARDALARAVLTLDSAPDLHALLTALRPA